MNIELNFREIGARIQSRRTELRMTQEILAELVGTSQKYISRIEVGYHNVKLETIAAIAKSLKVSVEYLIADYNNGNDENTLKLIMEDIRGMSPKQLDMLRDSIKMIKKI